MSEQSIHPIYVIHEHVSIVCRDQTDNGKYIEKKRFQLQKLDMQCDYLHDPRLFENNSDYRSWSCSQAEYRSIRFRWKRF